MSQPIDIIEEISNKPGAYGLTVLLTAPLPLEIGKFDRVTLKKGLYFYGGSAFGPGGLKARLARHIRPKNSLHWHIDHLTKAGRIFSIGALEQGSECRLVEHALSLPDARVPLPGFGSSDCRDCASHLVKLKNFSDIEKIFELAGITPKDQWRFS
jgi:histidyl-tRNA synthetase